MLPVLLLCCFSLCIVIGSYKNRSVGYKSPKEVVEAVVYAYQDQNDLLLQSCYDKSAELLRKDREIDFQRKFYLSVEANGVNIKGAEELFTVGNYFCIGVSFEFLLDSKKSIPYYEYYFVNKTGEGDYKIVTKLECPRELMNQFQEKKAQLQEDSPFYRKYKEETEKFVASNPSFADETYKTFENLLEGAPIEMERNLQLLGVVFVMAIIELGALRALVYFTRMRRRHRQRLYRIYGKKYTKEGQKSRRRSTYPNTAKRKHSRNKGQPAFERTKEKIPQIGTRT